MSNIPKRELIENTTFGVEIEMTGITREAAARVTASVLADGGQVIHHGGSYDEWRYVDQQGRSWKYVSDGSILTTGGHATSCELNTPPLTYSADIEKLQNLIRALRSAGAVSGAQYGCGIHVHVSGKGHTPQTVKNFVNILYSKDEVVRKSLGVSSDRQRWCQPINEDLVEKLKPCKTFEQLADAWYGTLAPYESRSAHYNHSRYHILNLHRFFSTLGRPENTIEIRAFNACLHAGVVRAYVLLVLSMNASALTQKTIRATKDPIMQAGNEKFAMRTWLNRMGWTGETFKNPHKLFLERLQGDSAYRFGKNGDRFH